MPQQNCIRIQVTSHQTLCKHSSLVHASEGHCTSLAPKHRPYEPFTDTYVAHYGSLLWSVIPNLVAQIWNFQNIVLPISPKFQASQTICRFPNSYFDFLESEWYGNHPKICSGAHFPSTLGWRKHVFCQKLTFLKRITRNRFDNPGSFWSIESL